MRPSDVFLRKRSPGFAARGEEKQLDRRKKPTAKRRRNQSSSPAPFPSAGNASLLERQYQIRRASAQTPAARLDLMREILEHCTEETRNWGPWFSEWFAQMFPQGQLQNWHALRERQEQDFAAGLDQRFVEEKQQRWLENLNAELENRRHAKEKMHLLETIAEQAKVSSHAATTKGGPSKQVQLTDREKRIWEVIQRGPEGLTYCRELDNAHVAPLRNGIWKHCPQRYTAAYKLGSPWTHRIQDEKSKIRRKAELAGHT